MPIELTTGVPGSGKTLYTVAKVLQDYLASPVKHGDQTIPRRLMVGGIPDLLLPHDLVEVDAVAADEFDDMWCEVRRLPGEPPLTSVVLVEYVEDRRTLRRYRAPADVGALNVLDTVDVVCRAINWWVWCLPGDVICLDECQRVFRPMPAGRKIPQYIAKLETHRHYGVDFVLITQHPQLLHVNVRNLIGRHRHVRRMFGRAFTVIYEWDHCTSPDRTKNATKTPWRHDRKAFGLYKSAELHTKHRHKLGYALVALFAVIPAAAAAWWYAMDRQKAATASFTASAAPSTAASQPHRASPQPTALATPVAVKPPAPQLQIAGGYCVGEVCVCYSAAGFRHAVTSDGCRRWLDNPPIDYWQLPAPRIEPEPTPAATTEPTT